MTSDSFYSYLFEDFDPAIYLRSNPVHDLFDIDLGEDIEAALAKIDKGIYMSVDPENKEPYPVELDDLTRLHYLVTSRKVTTVLEFGVGKSTKVLTHAMDINKQTNEAFVAENLRRSNPFEVHSVDSMKEWIEICKKSMPENLSPYSSIHHCPLSVSTFNDRLCTYYNGMPNICPDLIYLDAPDQFSAEGDVRGLTTAHPDRMPMAADILTFEHFLVPGTLILVDGRTANARFLQANLQRNWRYLYVEEFDQHFFELHEPPLGKYNKRQLDFCLKPAFFDF